LLALHGSTVRQRAPGAAKAADSVGINGENTLSHASIVARRN
jgi:hypothetical protein